MACWVGYITKKEASSPHSRVHCVTMGGSHKAGARSKLSKKASAASAAKQMSLQALGMPPLIAKPIQEVGVQIKVPGSYWTTTKANADGDKDMMYMCTIRDFSILHNFAGGLKKAAFQLQEMGPNGTGSLELGDSSGEMFWMAYPLPFLTHYYDTFPEKLEPAGPGLAPDGGEVEEAADSGGGGTASTNAGVADGPEALRSSPVWNSCTLEANTLIEMGPSRGGRLKVYRCTIRCGAGRQSECGAKRKITHASSAAPMHVGQPMHVGTATLNVNVSNVPSRSRPFHLLGPIGSCNLFHMHL